MTGIVILLLNGQSLAFIHRNPYSNAFQRDEVSERNLYPVF